MGMGLGLMLNLVGTGLGVAGALSEGAARKQQARYQAKVAEHNAQLSDTAALEARRVSRTEAANRDAEARKIMGQTVADQGASGVATSSTSFRAVRQAQGTLAKRDRINILTAGETDARNYLEQAKAFREEGGFALQAQKFNSVSTFLNVGTSLVGGATSILDYKRKQILAKD